METRTNLNEIKVVCINCGSNTGANSFFRQEARRTGKFLAKSHIDIVYGGASVGLMGEIANAALQENGRVIGIIPQMIADKVGHRGLTELHLVPTMHERKKRMFELSDGFIAFPGGLGTVEEIFELLTWGQLGFNRKPCGFLNIAGYFNKLIGFIDHAVGEGFIRAEHREAILVERDIESLLKAFRHYSPVEVEKWIRD